MTDCCPVNHEDLVKVRAPAVKNGHMTGFSAANFLRRLLHQRTPGIPSFLGYLPKLPDSSCA